MPPSPSPSVSGNPPPPPLSLHLLSTVTTASADSHSGSDMDTPAGEESPPSQPPPPTSPPSPSPPKPPSTAPSAPPSRPMPVREDCWSEEATATLVDAWGDRYLELNKGNLRQKHWQEVADAVNAVHGHTKKSRRTDIQCKNRIDTIKKKYKIEKAKTVDPRGAYISPWPFFSRLDSLIGDATVKKLSTSTATSTPSPATDATDFVSRRSAPSPAPSPALALTSPVPVGPRSFKPKRPAAMDDSFFRRTFAAAAAAASESEDEDADGEKDEPETSRSSGAGSRRRVWRRAGGGGGGGGEGCGQLAAAIMRFGEIYERVEGMKQAQMIELEKQRMQFAKELEFQRMKLLMDTQLQLAKIKRMKPSNDADAESY